MADNEHFLGLGAVHTEMGDDWAGSVQGPYPIGNASAQPDLRLAFPSPAARARDQNFRLIVRPDLWGREARLRFSNALGTRPVTFDGVHVGLQWTAACSRQQPAGQLCRQERNYDSPGNVG